MLDHVAVHLKLKPLWFYCSHTIYECLTMMMFILS